MRSWVLLLLAALTATRLRFGSAEGDPLPPSLVELVRNSPISSVEDLKQLLQQETDSVEDEEDEHDTPTNETHSRYTRSLVEAQPAQQAVCKVRTEVMEVTRAMLDRRNANFLLWPPCVEVQRCSGCCNTRLLQCVPTVTATRYLQVIKIQYINRNAHYDKAIISVEDHAGCRCQAVSASSSVPRSAAPSNPNPIPVPAVPQQQPAPHLPVPRSPQPAVPKTHVSKADLHRHDNLKHNQHHYQLEESEPLDRQWQPGRYSPVAHTPPQPHWTQPRVHVPTHTLSATHTQMGVHTPTHAGTHTQPAVWAEQGTTRGAHQTPRASGHGSGYEGARDDSGAHPVYNTEEVHHPDHTQRQQQLLQYQQQQQQYPYQQHQQYQPSYPQHNRGSSLEDQEMRSQYLLNTPQSDSASPPAKPTQAPNHRPGQDPIYPQPTNQSGSAQVTNEEERQQSKATNQTETEVAKLIQEDAKEQSGVANRANRGDTLTERPHHKKDSALTHGERSFTEEERRQKLLEILQREPEQQAPPHPHSSHPQHRPKSGTTTQKAVVPTVAPSLPTAPRVPFRPARPRRRRKHRGRISKAAIRAMIM